MPDVTDAADLVGTNLEIKARTQDLEAVGERARLAGAEPGGIERQIDRYFPVPGGGAFSGR